MTPLRATAQLAAERWFLERGLPYVLRPEALLRHVWQRSAPALAGYAVIAVQSMIAVAITGRHAIDVEGRPTRAEWFLLAIVVLVLPVAGLVGWRVSRIESWRKRGLVSAISVGIAVVGGFLGGPSPFVHIGLILTAAVLVGIFVCTATGVGSILGWAVKTTLSNLAAIGTVLIHALPVMLLTVLVFFNTHVWSMAATIGRPRLWIALLFLYLIAAAFLFSSTMSQAKRILDPDAERAQDAQALTSTPFETLTARLPRAPLSRSERLNVIFVTAMTQFAQVFTVALVTGAIFMMLGLILISPDLLDIWTKGGAHNGHIFGMVVPVPEALIQCTMFLTALTFMYLAARTVSDADYHARFIDPLIENLQVTLMARDLYQAYATGA